MNNLLSNKNSCIIYIPLVISEKELFIIELLDTCEAYLEPLKYGLAKEEIAEYLENEGHISLSKYLFEKKYIAISADFINLAIKYGNSHFNGTIECMEIVFNDVQYCNIEAFFRDYTIDAILSKQFKEDNKMDIRKVLLSKEGNVI